MKRFLVIFSLLFSFSSFGYADDTQCATAVFANALRASAESGAVDENAHEADMQVWIWSVFDDINVLRDVLNCPEIASVDDDEIIKFIPIEYTFPNGRRIVINYETQPTIFKQRILMAEKHDLPAGPDSADLTDGEAIWVNVDPAWYAIMVVEHGALDAFVGEGKNNTISMKYIDDNIDNLYPRGAMCTTKTGVTGNGKAIDKAVTNTVGVKETTGEDSNNYYVAGDRNLGWITYAEIAVDVVITVVTFGGGTAVAGLAKAARIMGVTITKDGKILKNAFGILHGLKGKIDGLIKSSETVAKFVGVQNKIARNTDRINDIKKAIAAGEKVPGPQDLKNISVAEQNLKRTQEARQAAAKANKGKKEMDKLRAQEKTAQQELNRLKNKVSGKAGADDIKVLEQEEKQLTENIKNMEKELDELRKADKTGDVAKYEEASQALEETMKYAKELRGTRALWGAKRGNVATRLFHTFKGVKAAMTGTKTLNRGARIARSGNFAAKAKDWLFHSTMRNLARLGKVEAAGGALYAVLKFAGDMYDKTETSTGDFTNNIEFKPLLLLSADDLPENDNVVNYGMWLLWMGDSISAADDDAAYLQAMDFAAKFYQDLSEEQNETNSPCNVDIFVVRPIIRNPGDMNQELYYLIMNDEPWSTANDTIVAR